MSTEETAATPKTPAVSVKLPGGPAVIIAILPPSEVLTGMKMAGKGDPTKIRDLIALNQGLLRVSIRQVDGKPVTFDELSTKEGWKELFPRTRYLMQLVKVWGSQHVPDDADRAAVKETVKVTMSGGGELWTVRLPPEPYAPKGSLGPEIVMREMDPESMGDALDDAQKAASSASLLPFTSAMKHGAKSIVQINGKGVTPEDLTRFKWDAHFSTFHTYLIGYLWTLLHEGEGELEVGEA